MDEHSQGRRYSQDILSSSNEMRYTSFSSSISCLDFLFDISTACYCHGQQQLGLPASVRNVGRNVDTDVQNHSHPVSTVLDTTGLSMAIQMPYKIDFDVSGVGADYTSPQQQAAQFGSYNTSVPVCNAHQANMQTTNYSTSQYDTSMLSGNNCIRPVSLFSGMADTSEFSVSTHMPEASAVPAYLEHTLTAAYYKGIPNSFHYTEGSIANKESAGNGSGVASLISVESVHVLADQNTSRLAIIPTTSWSGKTAQWNEQWQNYNNCLQTVFKDITEGELEKAADGLLGISLWLLSKVEELGKWRWLARTLLCAELFCLMIEELFNLCFSFVFFHSLLFFS